MDNILLQDIAKRDGYSKYRNAEAKTADYQATYDDRQIIIIADGANVTLTLPPKSSFPDPAPNPSYSQVLEIIAISTPDPANPGEFFKVTIQSHAGDTFSYGNTHFVVPANSRFIEIGLAKHGHHLRRELIADYKLGTYIDWDAYYWWNTGTADSDYTPIPFINIPITNTQPDFYTLDITNPDEPKVEILIDGHYDVSMVLTVDSRGNDSTWNVEGYLFVERAGSVIRYHSTKLNTGNYGSEDNSLSGTGWSVEFKAGDKIYIAIRNDGMGHSSPNILNGRLDYAIFQIRLRVG